MCCLSVWMLNRKVLCKEHVEFARVGFVPQQSIVLEVSEMHTLDIKMDITIGIWIDLIACACPTRNTHALQHFPKPVRVSTHVHRLFDATLCTVADAPLWTLLYTRTHTHTHIHVHTHTYPRENI
eukprot:GHVU01042556.1.p2 GENE.GHVU01042556.1~~GHVU01042556.1.p2  ORF type:complete len:125 (-),score=4.40 GHVU01042556.1:238-612(-)